MSVDWEAGRALTGSVDQTLKIWDLATGVCVQALEGHTGPVWAVSLEPGSGYNALSGSVDRHLMLWDLRGGVCSRAMLQHQRQVTAVSLDWSTFQAMSASVDRSIIFWDLEMGEPLSKFEEHSGTVSSLSVDWLGRRMCSGAGPGDNCVRLWNFGDEYCDKEIEGHTGPIWAICCEWELAHKAVQDMQGGSNPTE